MEVQSIEEVGIGVLSKVVDLSTDRGTLALDLA